jgi:peroxiredoxin (alkyl hydroperoxide reductase subunit C)
MAEFENRNTKIIAISIDSQFTHNAWRKTPVDKGGIGEVSYPMVADIDHSICQSYGIEHPVVGVALRATFLIDERGIVRAQVVNDLPLGRNIDEMIRLVDALQFVEEHGEVCPAGWQKGKKGMKASAEGVASYLAEHSDKL